MESLHWIEGLADKRGIAVALSLCLVGAGCSQVVPEPEPLTLSAGHLSVEQTRAAAIPAIVEQPPPAPDPARQSGAKYTVTVDGVPVRQLLFRLARDAQVNIDIAPGVQGMVTMNAVGQTLPRLLDRIARQTNLRYAIEDDNVVVAPDEPYFHTYRIDYLNIDRETSNVVRVGAQIAAGGAESGGNSTTTIDSAAVNRFWPSLVANVSALLGADGAARGQGGGAGRVAVSDKVIPHPESGTLTVKATGAQHKLVRALIDEAIASASRQVLIQATIVEVNLTDQFQAGIDWERLNEAGRAGFSVSSKTLAAAPVNTASLFSLRYRDSSQDGERVLRAALKLLEEFGDISVLSSPQLMALNNQSAILKVVDNIVYFEMEEETNTTQGVATNTFETTVKTVPVGIVMTVTPRINANGSIILNVRPSVSRVNRFVNDPNPKLTAASPVPEIRVREMEAVLRLNDGEIAVLGGLMQNDDRSHDNAIPGLSRIPLLGEVFRTRQRESRKTELVIFLRPVIVREPSLDGDLRPYRRFAPGNGHG